MVTMTDRIRTLKGHLAAPGSQGKLILQDVSQTVQSQLPGKRFRYTLDDSIFTSGQRQFYEENGYIVIKNLVPLSNLETYRKRFEEICNGKVKVPGLTVMTDVTLAKSGVQKSSNTVTKIQSYQFDDVLFEYCSLPQIVDYVESFIGPNIIAMHTMLINKPPDTGKKTSRHPMHQDLHYFPFRPADRIVCSWTAMEKVHRQNGCLVVVPGSHKSELKPHDYPEWEGGVNKLYHGIKDFDANQQWIYVEMDAGDTVFFHPLLFHGSGSNRTNGFRKAISCHYAAADCHFIDVSGTTQQVVADETMEVAVKRTGLSKEDIAFTDIWKLRSRLVKGEPTNWM